MTPSHKFQLHARWRRAGPRVSIKNVLIPKSRARIRALMKAEIAALYVLGVPIDYIMYTYGCSRWTPAKIVSRLGIKIHPHGGHRSRGLSLSGLPLTKPLDPDAEM